MQRTFLFTSEAVSEGHPDKLCDQISDGLVDALLERDPDAKTAIECACKNNEVFLLGEVNTTARLTAEDCERVVRRTIERVGYDDAERSIDHRTCRVHVFLDQQSPDIARAVHEDRACEDVGAGDQGLMSAYATDETRSMMPSSFRLATMLVQRLAEARRDGTLGYLRPDAKTQVTLRYYEDAEGRLFPAAVDTIVLSTQHDAGVPNERLRREVLDAVVVPTVARFEAEDLVSLHQAEDFAGFDYDAFYGALPRQLQDVVCRLDAETYARQIRPRSRLLTPATKVLINPSGRFVIGGPRSDAGLTGRKIVCDAFGGWSQVGGGAYSGKDYSKVDRSASYVCRHICKSLVAGGYAHRCQVQLGYAIGLADPVSVYVDTYGYYRAGVPRGAAGVRSEEELVALIRREFRLRPGQIVDDLGLRRPLFQRCASHGHFGRDGRECPWEEVRRL